jgi:hypothetical protein
MCVEFERRHLHWSSFAGEQCTWGQNENKLNSAPAHELPARLVHMCDRRVKVCVPVCWGGVVLEDGNVEDGEGENTDAVWSDVSLR